MLNHISSCNHPESAYTGSTIESMIDRTKELGIPYFAISDHGTLISILKSYNYASKHDMKIIPGVELYFKDDECKIIQNTPSQQIKYFKIIIHAKDQNAYQYLVKTTSDIGRKKVKIDENEFKLFNWEDLKQISKFNVTACTSDIECMVTKHLLVNNPKSGLEYYKKLKDIFGENFYPNILPFEQTQYWNAVIQLNAGNKTVQIPMNDKIETDAYKSAKAVELTRKHNKHKLLEAVYINNTRFKVAKEFRQISNTELIKTFQNLPSDLQTNANKFILALANKFDDLDRVLINNYSYYSTAEDQVVQNMKLGEEFRIQQKQHIRTIEEITPYLNTLGFDDNSIEKLVQNSYNWADKFKDFELKYNYKLPDCGQNVEQQLVDIIKARGRMKWNDPRYVKQFREEFELLTNNGVVNLIPYFLPIVEIGKFYNENGYLTGPSRGSAAGFLISYLIGITHVDPIKYNLSSARFLTIDRVKQGNFPDIDQDLESREPLVGEDGNSGYLFNKYKNNAAQISTRTLLRIKSSILDVNRFINKGTVEPEIEEFVKTLPNTPQGITDKDFVFGYEDADGNKVPGLLESNQDLLKYTEHRPNEWDIVKRTLSLPRQNSRHACFASGTLIDNNGNVGVIESANYSINKPIKTWFSGIKKTILVSMSNGISIRCTPDHKFLLPNNEEVEAQNLKGKSIQYRPFSNCSGDKTLSKDELFALGWGLNDGSFNKKYPNQTFYFTPIKDDESKQKILKYFDRVGINYWQDKKRKEELFIYLPYKKDNTNHTNHLFFESKYNYLQRLPKYFWTLTLECQCEFMKGFFSANGFILNTRPRIGTKLSSRLLISDICIWLNSIGIETNVQYKKPSTIKITDKAYLTHGWAELVIVGDNSKQLFKKMIGFEQSYKQDRLLSLKLFNKNNSHNPYNFKSKNPVCTSIIEQEECDVYDFNEPLENKGYINGILVHNCAYVISNEPIENTVPTFKINDIRVTQPEAKQVEFSGLIKYDFLVVSALRDIRLCLDYINKKQIKKADQIVGWWHSESDCASCYHCDPNINLRDEINMDLGIEYFNHEEAKIWDKTGNSIPCSTCGTYLSDVDKLNTGYFTHNGVKTFIWDLPEDQDVYNMLASGQTETVFQFNTQSMTPFVQTIAPKNIIDCATITALVRPGPLDFKDELTGRNMAEEYIERRFGRSKGNIEILNSMIPESYGIIVYQESVSKIARELAGMSIEDSENVRIAMGKRKLNYLIVLNLLLLKGLLKK